MCHDLKVTSCSLAITGVAINHTLWIVLLIHIVIWNISEIYRRLRIKRPDLVGIWSLTTQIQYASQHKIQHYICCCILVSFSNVWLQLLMVMVRVQSYGFGFPPKPVQTAYVEVFRTSTFYNQIHVLKPYRSHYVYVRLDYDKLLNVKRYDDAVGDSNFFWSRLSPTWSSV